MSVSGFLSHLQRHLEDGTPLADVRVEENHRDNDTGIDGYRRYQLIGLSVLAARLHGNDAEWSNEFRVRRPSVEIHWRCLSQRYGVHIPADEIWAPTNDERTVSDGLLGGYHVTERTAKLSEPDLRQAVRDTVGDWIDEHDPPDTDAREIVVPDPDGDLATACMGDAVPKPAKTKRITRVD